MEKFLQIIEAPVQPNEVEMDPEKLTVFNSKLKVCDFAKILASEFENLPFDDKSSSLKRYYVDMLSKYSDGKGKICYASFFG